MDNFLSIFRPGLDPRNRTRLLGVGLAYFFAHQLAFLFPDSAGMLVAVWPAGGIGLAALLLHPRSLWPTLLSVMFGAGVAANLLSGRPVLVSGGFMVANIAESAACAWFITWWCGSQISFRRVNEIGALIVAAVVINADTAFLGAGAAALSADQPFWSFYKNWWIADGLGLLLLTPLIVLWSHKLPQPPAMAWKRKLELGLLLLISSLGVWLVFGANHAKLPITPHSYMLCLVLIWTALRFGPRTTATVLALVGVLAIGCTALGQGSFPLGGQSQIERLLMVQTFIGIVGIVSLLLSTSQAERKLSEDSLRRSETRLRALSDNLPNGMIYQVVREPDGTMRFLHASAAVGRLNGLTAEEVMRDSAALIGQIVEEDRLAVAAAAAESIRTMGIFNQVVRLRRADGELRWMQFCAAPRFLPDGRLIWDGIQSDITELRLTKQALTASEALLRQFIKYAPAAVAMLDNEMRYVQASDRWLTDYHLLAQDIIGKSHYEVFPDIPDRWREVHRRVLAGAAERCDQDPFPRADGTIEWLHWEVRPWFKADGQIGGLIMFTQVITERRRVEDALRLSENHFRSAMQNSPIGMGLVALDGSWVEVNPALCRIVGYPAEELVGASVQAITHPDDRAEDTGFIAESVDPEA
jgi:PAS domain S-box-containing protein